jgi:hypothetical protein
MSSEIPHRTEAELALINARRRVGTGPHRHFEWLKTLPSRRTDTSEQLEALKWELIAFAEFGGYLAGVEQTKEERDMPLLPQQQRFVRGLQANIDEELQRLREHHEVRVREHLLVWHSAVEFSEEGQITKRKLRGMRYQPFTIRPGPVSAIHEACHAAYVDTIRAVGSDLGLCGECGDLFLRQRIDSKLCPACDRKRSTRWDQMNRPQSRERHRRSDQKHAKGSTRGRKRIDPPATPAEAVAPQFADLGKSKEV